MAEIRKAGALILLEKKLLVVKPYGKPFYIKRTRKPRLLKQDEWLSVSFMSQSAGIRKRLFFKPRTLVRGETLSRTFMTSILAENTNGKRMEKRKQQENAWNGNCGRN